MIGSKFGHFLDGPLSHVAKRIPLSPNTLTVTGFLLTLFAAWVLSLDLLWGGILILLSGLFDMLDGIVARTRNMSTQFGAFLDSVLDRYSDAFLFLGLSWYLFGAGSLTGVFLSLATMVGALLVSYTRARAEGLGKECEVGIMERPERVILLAFGAMTGWIMPVIWIMLVLTHITVIQRVYHVWKALSQQS